MKNRIVLFAVGCFVWLFSSCLGTDETNYELSMDCQIMTFSLSSDSISGLSSTVFAIDQLKGAIFNIDSMPYGTVMDRKVVCTMDWASSVLGCQAIQEATGDTIAFTSGDSLDFSKPVKFITTLWDGKTTRAYLAQVNIHQVEPDSMVWSLHKDGVPAQTVSEEKVIVWNVDGVDYYYMYTSKDAAYTLYCSVDALDWKTLPLSGLPAGKISLEQITSFCGSLYVPSEDGQLYRSRDGQTWSVVSVGDGCLVKVLLGAIIPDDLYAKKQIPVLATIVEQDGVLRYASMTEDSQWQLGTPLEKGFPISGFGTVAYTSMYRTRLLVVAGRDSENQLLNTSWSTDDGCSWTMLTDIDYVPFDKQEGVAMSIYDGKIYLLSGRNVEGNTSSNLYTSRDGGVTWSLSDKMVVLPNDFKARSFASMIVDADQYMYLFGGKEANKSSVTNEIWRGRINRLGFK